MKLKYLPLILFNLLTIQNIVAQHKFGIGFENQNLNVRRDKFKNEIFKINVNLIYGEEDSLYNVNVRVVENSSNIPTSAFKLNYHENFTLGVYKSHVIYFELNSDSIPDRERTIKLTIEVSNSSGKNISVENGWINKDMVVNIAAIQQSKEEVDTLRGFEYLTYIGTNFDLVDGIKAKNVFYAVNVFLPNKHYRFFSPGLFVSLYGNRAISAIDTATNESRIGRIDFTSDTAIYYYNKVDRVTSFSSDNLGAYFSPILNMGNCSNDANFAQIYFAPSIEFVWRRTNVLSRYSNATPSDTLILQSLGATSSYISPDEDSYNSNEYQLNIGAGFFIRHESKRISLRLYFSVGDATLYKPNFDNSNMVTDPGFIKVHDVFFSGRLWITEAASGVTIQAEVLNTYRDPRPYYGVTLSKAINFQSISRIFDKVN